MFKSPFLAVQSSPWPLFLSLNLFRMLFRVVVYIITAEYLSMMFLTLILTVLMIFLWWKDFSRESLLGYHTHKLELSLRCAMLLFILSEVFFFLSFFWAFFDASLAPTIEIGITWPPKGIATLSVYGVPLLNTVILLTSGVTVTWAHHSLMENKFGVTFIGLFITVALGVYFLFIQYTEYMETSFTIADSVYGSTFFMATGFHGIHVFVGTTFLFYVTVNLLQSKLLFNHHFSFEAAAWYWHFVDVVWLILFLCIYWWGSL